MPWLWTRYERDGTLSVPPCCSVYFSGCWETLLELRSLKKPLPYLSLLPRRLVSRTLALYVQGLEYRSGEDHVSSVASWVILRAPVGPLRPSFRTDRDVEPLVMEGAQTLADILA